MVKLKDISIYFSLKSSCCNKQESSPMPCRNSPQILDTHKYFKYWYNKGVDIDITTITIGSKWLGRMSADEQYKQFVKDIKKGYPFHGKTKYVYHFELQNNGMLHAHGIHMESYRDKFIETFDHYGKRNSHKESYQVCRNITGYLEYINKSNIYPPIHNVLKKDMLEIPE